MGNFVLPRFQYIINTDAQTQLYGDSGSGPVAYTDGLVTPTSGKFSLIGTLDWTEGSQVVVLSGTTRIRAEVAVTGTAQELDCTPVVPSALSKGTTFRVVTSQPSLENTAYQNIPLQKIYQLSEDCADAAAAAANIAAVINADPHALVTASEAAGVVTITDKDISTQSAMYASDGWSITLSVSQPMVVPVNTYDMLKNMQWSNAVDFDRNAEWFPERGASYKSYYFQIDATEVANGGLSLPSQLPGTSRTEFIYYVKDGLTLQTALDAFVGDMNV